MKYNTLFIRHVLPLLPTVKTAVHCSFKRVQSPSHTFYESGFTLSLHSGPRFWISMTSITFSTTCFFCMWEFSLHYFCSHCSFLYSSARSTLISPSGNNEDHLILFLYTHTHTQTHTHTHTARWLMFQNKEKLCYTHAMQIIQTQHCRMCFSICWPLLLDNTTQKHGLYAD